MDNDSRTVLIISDDAAATRRVQKSLGEPGDIEWHLTLARRLNDGINCLTKRTRFDAVILDLILPDSHGLNTFETFFKAALLVPILVLADRKDETIALQTTRLGAQDYLLKDHIDAYWLLRMLRSVMTRKATEETIFVEKERAMVTLNSIGDAVLSTDIAGNVSYLNLVAEEMTGWSSKEAVGRPLAEVFNIINGTTRLHAADPMARAIRENRTVGLSADCVLIRRDGFEYAIEDSAAPIHDRGGRVTGAVIVFRDRGMARSVVQKMTYLAQHDYLTRLPNRLLLDDRIATAITLARRHGKHVAVLYLDLDDFKAINDTFGHLAGDKLLQSIVQRIQACVRNSDTVSRQGGDEFVILLSEIEQVIDAGLSAEKILLALTKSHTITGQVLHITASIGISIYPTDGQDAETLIRCADSAMYHAKGKGRKNYRFFAAGMNDQPRDLHKLEKPQTPHLQDMKIQPTLPLESGMLNVRTKKDNQIQIERNDSSKTAG